MKSSVELLDYSPNESTVGGYARFTRTPFSESNAVPVDDEKNLKVLVNCFNRKHMSVFEFITLTFDVTCPIFVARQLMRHRNGVFMEKSMRHLKPSTSDIDGEYAKAYALAVAVYDRLVEDGYRREQARAVLPLCTPTRFLWKITARSLFNVFEQRISREAQEETREVAIKLLLESEKVYPTIISAWRDANEEASAIAVRYVLDSRGRADELSV